MITKRWVLRAVVCTFAFASSVLVCGQTPSSCSPITLVSVPELTFKQRACFYGQQLLSPTFALRAGFMSAFGQFRNSPHMTHHDFGEFPHRFEVYYATRAARDAGELLAGYMHHEDLRFRRGDASGFRHRTNSALLSVLTSPGEDGRRRVAYAPIAGSVSSAVVGSLLYRHSETLEDMAAHAGIIYSGYFVRALFREFKPEMNSYTRHILRRDRN